MSLSLGAVGSRLLRLNPFTRWVATPVHAWTSYQLVDVEGSWSLRKTPEASRLGLRGLWGAEAGRMLHTVCHGLRKLSNVRVHAGLVIA